jgi:hypothetical protein
MAATQYGVITAKAVTIPKEGASLRHPRPRNGKTAKDKKNNAHNTAYANRQARASWQNSGGEFPFAHCNGQRNRHQFTGRGNTLVVLTIKSSNVSTAKAKKK